MAAHNKLLAIASGLLAGGFLFQRFGFEDTGALSGWKWYQGAVLLCGIGLAGIFPKAWQGATIGLAIAPTLIMSVVFYRHPGESMWPIVLPMIFLYSLPAPLIGSGISALLKRTRLPRAVYSLTLTFALVIGALLPNIQNAQRQRFQTEKVPGILKQIYDGEMIYSARQPDGNFACEGTLLPGAAGKMGWAHSDESPTVNNYLRVEYYNIRLDCPNAIKPHRFRVTAFSNDGNIHAPRLTMNETGELVVVPRPNTR
jgi:hypothetical protein